MAKRKRQNNAVNAKKSVEDFYNPSDSKLQINSYEDVADSEDEFFMGRDKVALEDGPEAKRRRGYRNADMVEASDEEVLGYGDDADSDSDIDGADRADGDNSEEDEDEDGWGTSRNDYYNTDKIETEQDALDEEAEARRIQQKRLKALRAADFAFDPQEWAQRGSADEMDAPRSGGIITEVLPQLQVSDSMTVSEKETLLKGQYPEIEHLSKELIELHKIHAELRQSLSDPAVLNEGERLVLQQKHRALSSYLSSLALYFALLTSPAQSGEGKVLPLPAHELREHEVMESLVRTRGLWSIAKDLAYESLSPASDDEDEEELDDDRLEIEAALEEVTDSDSEVESQELKAEAISAAQQASRARREERLRRTEETLAALSAKPTRLHKSQTDATAATNESDSDRGDKQTVSAQEAAAKADKRKSLRFYTSQIAQKASRRSAAGRAAGGDDDIPHRERLRDRSERLLREAEKRGRRSQKDGRESQFDDDVDDREDMTNFERERRYHSAGQDDGEEGAEQRLRDRVQAKKESKRRREDAYQQAKAEGGVVVRHSDALVGPDGRRDVGYAIEKNKGLTPRRKKEARNPRVKKRLRYEDKSKKLRSMKQVYRGGEGKGGYRGELTGIKAGLVRSVKL